MVIYEDRLHMFSLRGKIILSIKYMFSVSEVIDAHFFVVVRVRRVL